MQPLEQRQLLAADFVASFSAGALTFPIASEQSVVVRVDNIGPDAARGRPEIRVYASSDDVLDSSDRLIGKGRLAERLGPGGFAEQAVNVRLPASMATGSYRFIATVDEKLNIAEEDESNNVVVSEQVLLTNANVDVSVSIASSKLGSELVGDKVNRGSVTVNMMAMGTSTLLKGSRVEVRAFLRLADAVDGSSDIAISSARRESVESLLKSGLRTSTLNVAIPREVAEGAYRVVVKIDAPGALAESNEENNEATLVETIFIAAPRVDLSLSSASFQTVRQGELRGVVNVSNLGNTRSRGEATIQFFVVQEGRADIAVSQAVTRKFELRAGGISSAVRLKVALPAGAVAEPGARLVARMTPSAGVGDTNASNHTFDLGDWPLASQV